MNLGRILYSMIFEYKLKPIETITYGGEVCKYVNVYLCKYEIMYNGI